MSIDGVCFGCAGGLRFGVPGGLDALSEMAMWSVGRRAGFQKYELLNCLEAHTFEG